MKFRNLFETTTEPDFVWYENPTLQQINHVAGESDKVRFAALFNGRVVIVFPFEERPKEFLQAIGKNFDLLRTIHGVAQKAGVGWLVTKILNLKNLKEDGGFHPSNWEWLNKYFNLRYFLEKEKEEKDPNDPEEMKKNLHLSLDKKMEKEGKLSKVSLKDFMDKYKHGKN